MGTPRTTNKPEMVSREEFDQMMQLVQKQATPNPMFRAWSNFFYAFFGNPKTTLAGIGAAIPVLTQAYQSQDYVLAISGISVLLTGALAGDARKQKPPTDDIA
jgi:hypothetical protein